MSKLEILCEEIISLQNRHHELYKNQAYAFNIFSFLLESDDNVNLHTKFIYELLNPEGSHQQGRLFLDLFLEELLLDTPQERVDVLREKDGIDIFLQSSDTAIVIENRVETKEHSSQLRHHGKKMKKQGYKKSDIHLIYLTLLGEQPLKKKTRKRALTVSYKEEITSWLKSAIHWVEDIPILRETLVQYLWLVQELTDQPKEMDFTVDVKNLLLQKSNLKTILEIDDAVVEAKTEVQFNFWQTLLSQLSPHYRFKFYNIDNQGLKSRIRMDYRGGRERKDYGIRYKVDENLSFFIGLGENIYYGFEFLDEDSVTREQRDALDRLKIEWSGISKIIYWKYPTTYLNFKEFNHQNLFDLIDKRQQREAIKKISDEVIGMIFQYENDSLCLEQ